MTIALDLDVRARVVIDFFDAYRNHDVEAMVDMCTDIAEYRQAPFEMWGRQRVIRGDGHVRTIGKVMWTGLINAFPDLTNVVTTVAAGENGNVLAEVVLAGTQGAHWGVIGNRGLAFTLPQVVLFRVNDAGQIDSITSYWDNASFYLQLGHLEVD